MLFKNLNDPFYWKPLKIIPKSVYHCSTLNNEFRMVFRSLQQLLEKQVRVSSFQISIPLVDLIVELYIGYRNEVKNSIK